MSQAETIAPTEPAAAAAPDWDAIRAEFPAADRFTYFDIGRKALLPRMVKEAMNAWIDDVYETGGQSAFSLDGIEATRSTVADVFGAAANTIAFVKNTSEGINIVAQGFPWREGDNVVIGALEHAANSLPWRHLQRRGIEVREAQPDAQGRITVDQYRKLVDARTRVLSVAWVAYRNGYRADLAALSAFCRENDVRLVVDGIQAVGNLDQRLDSLGVDLLVAGGHKSQLCVSSCAILYVTPEMTELLTPPYAAKFSFTSIERDQTDPVLLSNARRFEYGAHNFLGLWVQRHSAEFIRSIGLANIEARVREISTYLLEQAEERGFNVITPRPWHERAGTVSFDVGGRAEEIEARLRRRRIVTADKEGVQRASTHFYNNHQDVDRFLDGFAAVMAEL